MLSRLLLVLSLSLLAAGATPAPAQLAERARAALRQVAEAEEGWIKVHAADVLIALGQREEARQVFAATPPSPTDRSPHRVGILRTFAQTAHSPAEREPWLAAVEAIFLDPTATDRLQAIETLAKLRHPLSRPTRTAAEALAGQGTDADASLALWALATNDHPPALARLIGLLRASDPIARLRAAYALRWLQPDDEPVRQALAAAADAESRDSPAFAYVLASALAVAPAAPSAPGWRTALEQVLTEGAPGPRYEAAQVLMKSFRPADLPRVLPLFDHPHGDVRLAAAWTVLHVLQP